MQGHWFRTLLIYAAIVIALINIYPTVGWQFKGKEERERIEEQIIADQLTARAEQYGALDRLAMQVKHWWWCDPAQQITLGLDLQGGLQMVVGFDMTEEAKARPLTEAEVQEIVLNNIINRISELDVQEPVIQKQGTNRVLIQLPGVTDTQRATELIMRVAHLGFHIVSGQDETEQAIISVDRALGNELIPYLQAPEFGSGQYEVPEENVERVREVFAKAQAAPGALPEGKAFVFGAAPESWEERGYEIYLMDKAESLSGEGLKQAVARPNTQNPGQWLILFEFNAEAAQQFSTLTENNIGRQLGIVLDGNMMSAPTIRGRISGSGEIEGNFTADEAKDLAITLNSGSMPVPVREEYTGMVGSTVGRESVESGVRASLIGLVIVIVFMTMYYRVSGVVANITQIVNALLLVGAFAYFNITLTLPGIAGLILTIGMAVDANVLIFERVREELRTGKSVANSINAGYERAASAIIDSNLTTLIAAIVLLQFGSGPIQGFAIALSIGIVTSVFVALVVSRALFDFMIARKMLTTLSMASVFPPNTRFEFMSKRAVCIGASAIFIVVGFGMFGYRSVDGTMFGVDFTEGTSMQVRLHSDAAIDVGAIRGALEGAGFPSPTVQDYTGSGTTDSKNVFAIRIGKETNVQPGSATVSGRVQEALAPLTGSSAGPAESVELEDVLVVGPVVGAKLQKDAALSIGYSLFFTLIYLWFRFHWTYAMGAVVAVFHDVLFVVGLLALTGREMSLDIVAALLTIIGYSLNDTIVIFDRVREDMRIYKGREHTFLEVLDIAINQTLSRTILTSLLTLFVVVVLFVSGGPKINDFAFALMVGMVVGTYSTIYIASPVTYFLQRRAGHWLESAEARDKGKKRKDKDQKKK